jgi:hypothetical protein
LNLRKLNKTGTRRRHGHALARAHPHRPRVARRFLQRTDASASPRWTCTSVGSPPRPWARAPRPSTPRPATRRSAPCRSTHGRMQRARWPHLPYGQPESRPRCLRACHLLLNAEPRRRRFFFLCVAAQHPAPWPDHRGRPNSTPRQSSAARSALPLPCSSLNPQHRRRAAPPRCRQPAGHHSGRTGAPRRRPAAAPFPTRPRRATTLARLKVTPATFPSEDRPPSAAAGRQFHRRRGQTTGGLHCQREALFRGTCVKFQGPGCKGYF